MKYGHKVDQYCQDTSTHDLWNVGPPGSEEITSGAYNLMLDFWVSVPGVSPITDIIRYRDYPKVLNPYE
jgi:hypothetical protein